MNLRLASPSWLALLRLVLLAALVASAILMSGPAWGGTILTEFTYLPVLQQPPAGIFGRVTVGGVPAGGVSLDLLFYDGSDFYLDATTTTDSNGEFLFANVPSLNVGEAYLVWFFNDTNPSRLSYWTTRVLETYDIGDAVNIGEFDVADIELLDPVPEAGVALPYTFRWNVRPTSPTDSYYLTLYEYETGDPYASTDLLGYVGSFTVGDLPSGFSTDTWYVWGVGAYAPDGGFGEAYWVHDVYFTSGWNGTTTLVDRTPAVATRATAGREAAIERLEAQLLAQP